MLKYIFPLSSAVQAGASARFGTIKPSGSIVPDWAKALIDKKQMIENERSFFMDKSGVPPILFLDGLHLKIRVPLINNKKNISEWQKNLPE